MPKKVMRKKFTGACKRCGVTFDLDDACIHKMEHDDRSEPFKARRASGRVHCMECGHQDLDVHYEYAQKYRVRCQACKKMFDADFSNATRCQKCDHEHLIALSKLGV